MLFGKGKNIDLDDIIKELVEKQRPNVKKVIKNLDSIIKREPDNIKARAWKAAATIVQARLERHKNPLNKKWRKILNDGLSQLKKIMERDPTIFSDEKLAVETVMQLCNVAAIDVALEVVNVAIKYNPSSELLWIGKINVLQGLNKTDEVIETCKQAMELFKDKAIFKQYHAVALAIAGRYDEALSVINKYLEEDPGSIELAKGKARILMSMKRYEETVKFIDEFVSRIPEMMSSKLDLIKIKGEALYHMERYDDALKVFKEVLKHNKNDADALYYIGAILNKQYRFKEAYRYLKKAVELDPENVDAWFKLAYALEMMDYDDRQQFLDALIEARDAIERALFFDPDNMVYKLKKANIIRHLGMFDEKLLDEAWRLFKDILKRTDDSTIRASALCNLGNVLSDKGRYEEAIRYYREAIKADPNFVITYFDFAYLYELLGRYDDALKCLREVYKHTSNDYWRREAEKYIKEIKRRLS